jgi:hypothetical protein
MRIRRCAVYQVLVAVYRKLVLQKPESCSINTEWPRLLKPSRHILI